MRYIKQFKDFFCCKYNNKISARSKDNKFFFQRTLTGDEQKSELLPTGWNDKDNYALRYLLENKLYILHALSTDGNLIINLMVTIP